ncbi:MAG: hypothetical protein HOE03_00500 [Nitrosomonadales bacterium]|nr:hypothetical protein [Nitrosomonadales bacterium]MBT7120979.1 hypothetical protein [Nitrosomonadales bacterium]MBT7482483.1 hypothetical protein [Nitrosomonadales bacterium]
MKIKYIFIFILILMNATFAFSEDKTINFKCKGIATFELMGSSGKKEEVKTISFNFIEGALQDLNNIDCTWSEKLIRCKSNFLNIRNLEINRKNNSITDYISGNKGFGQYIETFSGDCEPN